MDKINNINIFLNQYPYIRTIVYSVIVIFSFIVINFFIKRRLTSSLDPKSPQYDVAQKFSAWSYYLLLVLLTVMWFSQLQAVFVSLFAVAAAIVVAFKELIMCLTGGLLIKYSKMLKIGQRIQVDDIRGIVIESKLFVTKVLEIGPEKNSQQTTGNVISLPNSIMLSKPLKNESYFNGYSVKSFEFKSSCKGNYKDLEDSLLKYADSICENYTKKAQKAVESYLVSSNVKIPNVNPKTKIRINDNGDVIVVLKLPVKNDNVSDIEQKLYRHYLSL